MESAVEVVIATQNAWGGAPRWRNRERRLARYLEAERPAVLGLQEIHAPSTSGEGSQAHALARQTGYRAFFWPGQVATDGRCEGNALLCRGDIAVLGSKSTWLSLDAKDPLDRVTRRVIAQTTVRASGVILDVFVTHLPISKRARARTIHEVLAFAAEGRRASGSAGAVLMGDLNASPREAPIRALLESWTDTWRAAHPRERGGTWPSISPVIRLDYIFAQLGDQWSIGSCERSFAGSDHAGLHASIRLPLNVRRPPQP
jgi:endonuclease/exonuclease/phosphatase family metal-dependent hydrolase